MNPTCDRGFDANDVAEALREEGNPDIPDFSQHLKACLMCQQNVHVIRTAREAWRSAALVDDARARNASERRLVRAWRTPRPAFGWRSALIGAAIASVIVLRFGPRWPEVHAPVTVPVASVVPSASVTTPPVIAPAPPASARAPSFMVMRDCPACARSGMAANSTLDAPAEVPRGASLMLSWAMPGESEPASSLEVTGPARVAPLMAREKGESPALQIDRGNAEVHTYGESEIVSPHATMHTLPKISSSWHFEVTPTRTNIVVDAGWVAVGAVERKAPSIHLLAGQSAEVRSGGEIILAPRSAPSESSRPAPAPPKVEAPKSDKVEPPAPSPSAASAPAEADTDASLWQSVQTALHAGDRAVAETKARSLMLSGRSANYRDKASFVVGELELSRGDVAGAQGRLSSLASTTRDPALAADATFLLARSYKDPLERARVWGRFIASGPASPYREQAMLERGRALADAGDMDGAREIVAALKKVDPLPAIVARGLAALEARTAR
ncbi:tetratricopeptide repeat protein [Pendulispora brunnea]|uniref:Tetratricopeptide repeat protein n=1 Tax=Pendulispora brunnea TaxID=2905690 RepID=A0ABZ2K5N0_9BACT